MSKTMEFPSLLVDNLQQLNPYRSAAEDYSGSEEERMWESLKSQQMGARMQTHSPKGAPIR
jgi:hypothetical protein